MTIYLYVQYFPPYQDPVHNGVVKAVHGLATGLAACGEAVTVLSEGPQAATVNTRFGYQHRCFVPPRTALSWTSDLRRFIQQQITPRDLVIVNGGWHFGVYACTRMLLAQGIPYVMAPHLSYDANMFAKSRCRKLLYWYACERSVLRSAQAVQVLDQRQGVWLTQRGITTPTIAVPNGFDPNAIDAWSSIQWRSPTTPAQLLFFGRLCRHTKGLDLLLNAFADLSDRLDQAAPELVLQGPDPGDRAGLVQLARSLKIHQRVQFRPADYHTPTSHIMAPADIVCLTSRSEGFGLAALEGMLAGRVLLVTENAGIAQHVRASGCGVVVKPTVAGIRVGLNRLLACREDWPAMGLRGRQRAIEQLPWPQIAAQARPHYQAIIDGRRRDRGTLNTPAVTAASR
jgi:glycosyltransferase involved in cell wall biosynthesis